MSIMCCSSGVSAEASGEVGCDICHVDNFWPPDNCLGSWTSVEAVWSVMSGAITRRIWNLNYINQKFSLLGGETVHSLVLTCKLLKPLTSL
jgi:hypothetical protein